MIDNIKKKWHKIPLSIKVSTSYAVCNILQRCLSFITLPLFTRLLKPEQYGQYTIYSSWSGILMIFITLNLAYGSFSTAMIKYEKQREEYIASVETICLLLAVIFFLLYLPFRTIWNTLFELPTLFVLIMVLEILSNAAIQFWSGKKRFEFKYKSVIAVTLLSSIFSSLFAFIFVINSHERGYARILGYAIPTIVLGGGFFIYNMVKGRKFYSREHWNYALGFNIPLMTYYLSQIIFNQSDRIMINHYCGVRKAAIYGVAYNLSMILSFALSAVNNSYVPWLYGKIKENKLEENKALSCNLAILIAVLLLFVIWYAPEIIYFMAGSEYTEAIMVVAPVSMSLLLLFYSQFFIHVQFYHEEKKSLIGASIGASLINIVLNALLIPKFTFIVAGYTTLVSYIIFTVANYNAMKRVLKKHDIKEAGYDHNKLTIIFVIFTFISLLGVSLYNYLFFRMIVTVIVFLILICFRKPILRSIMIK